MIDFDAVQCVGCDVLCCLLEITDSGCILILLHDRVECFVRDPTLLFLKAHSLKHLRQIYKCAEETGTDFSLLLEAIANDSIGANIHGEFAKWLNTLFDFLDDELLAMHGLCFQGSTYKKFVSFTIDGPQHEFDFAIEIYMRISVSVRMVSGAAAQDSDQKDLHQKAEAADLHKIRRSAFYGGFDANAYHKRCRYG